MVSPLFTFAEAVYNLVRMRNLVVEIAKEHLIYSERRIVNCKIPFVFAVARTKR